MKKAIIIGMTLLLLAANAGCTGSGDSNGAGIPEDSPTQNVDYPQPGSASYTNLPQIMFDDTIYCLSNEKLIDTVIPEHDYVGSITPIIPWTHRPIKNGEANFDIEEGAPFARHEKGIVVLWNDEWTVFTAEKELLDQTEALEQGASRASSTGDGFEVKLFSDKEVYKSTDAIQIWATLEYIGDEDAITIWHGYPYMSFSLTDGKDFNVEGITLLVSVSTEIEKGTVYRSYYQKSGGWDADGPDASFWEDFYKEKDLILPAGDYTVTVRSDFSLTERPFDSESGLSCELKIKVEQ
jgi:hypothetical protein